MIKKKNISTKSIVNRNILKCAFGLNPTSMQGFFWKFLETMHPTSDKFIIKATPNYLRPKCSLMIWAQTLRKSFFFKSKIRLGWFIDFMVQSLINPI